MADEQKVKGFRLIYDIANFRLGVGNNPHAEAKSHFDSHWREDDPMAGRALKESEAASIKDLYPRGGAHYHDGRWHIIRELEVYNFTKFEAGTYPPTESSLAENLMARCPQCGQTAYPYSVQPAFTPPLTIYAHVLSIQDGKRIDLAYHAVPQEQWNIIDISG